MENIIRTISIGGTSYEFASKFIQDESGNIKQWSDIVNLVDAGIQLITDSPRINEAPDGPIGAPITTASIDTLGKIYLIEDKAISGDCVEWITIYKQNIYRWEKIGTTSTDLSEYVKKNTYTTQSDGLHTHSVKGSVVVPTISSTSKKMSASADGTKIGVSATTDAIVGFNIHTTKNALGENATFLVNGGTVSKTVNVPSSVTVNDGKKASWNASVKDGILTMNFTANTPTNVSVGNNVTVATNISPISVIANNKDIVSSITTLGKPITKSVATDVAVISQPTIKMNANASSGVDYIDTISIGYKSAEVKGSTNSSGNHTHNIKL